jgi:tRNA-dihydrouridine synthase B
MSIRLGSLSLESDLVLAPMMDVTTPSLRLLIKQFGGVGFIVTPMVFVSQISAARKTLAPHLEMIEKQRPAAVQIVASGRNEHYIKEAVEFLETYQFDVIDINAGCPAPHTMKSGGGGAFLKPHELPRLQHVIEYCLKYASRPVSVKTRLGYEEPDMIDPLCKMFHNYNLAFITVHGRTVRQKYSGTADYAAIRRFKEQLSIPIIGNGDVRDLESYLKIKAETGCDAVMIGRAMMSNVYLFQRLAEQIHAHNNQQPIPEYPFALSIAEIRSFLQQLVGIIEQLSPFWNNPRFKLAELRRLAIWGIKGIPGYKKAREIMSKIMDYEKLADLLFGPKFEQLLQTSASMAQPEPNSSDEIDDMVK